MELLSLNILGWVGMTIGGAILTALGWLVKRVIDKTDNHEVRINNLEIKVVTTEDVRNIVGQSNATLVSAISNLTSDVKQTNATTQSVLIELAKRQGYDLAIKEMNKQ